MMDAKLEAGKTYEVTLDDCCICGDFTASLLEIRYSDSDLDKEYPEYLFDNGVRLDTHNGCRFGEIGRPSSLFMAG